MTKRVVAAILALVLAATVGLAVGCGGEESDDALAKVGGTAITQKQLDEKVADFERQYPGYVPSKETDPEGYKSFQQDVLDYMVTYEIARQKAESLGVTVTDEDVQAEIDTILSDSFGGDQGAFDAALAEQNMTVEQLKKGYKESMLLQKTYEAVTKDVTTVPDDEIAAYYEGNKDYYFVDETRTARHILIAPSAGRTDGTTSTTTAGATTTSEGTDTTGASSTTTTAAPTAADWAAALETAQKVRADLVAGADWTEEAAKYSDDLGSKNSGGDLGTVSKGETVPEFDEALFSLAEDAISQPIKTSYGYHVIQVTGINEAKQYGLEEVKEDIVNVLVDEKKSQAWSDWLEKMKAEIGVTYARDWQPTTTTEASVDEATTTSEAPATTTTAAPTTTSAAAPSTTATTGATTSTSPGASTTSTTEE